METETLKAVVEMFNQLGPEAKDAFIWWLLIKHGATYLFGFLWTGIALILLLIGYRIFQSLSASYILMKAAGVRISWNNQELEQACEILRKYYRDGGQ